MESVPSSSVSLFCFNLQHGQFFSVSGRDYVELVLIPFKVFCRLLHLGLEISFFFLSFINYEFILLDNLKNYSNYLFYIRWVVIVWVSGPFNQCVEVFIVLSLAVCRGCHDISVAFQILVICVVSFFFFFLLFFPFCLLWVYFALEMEA